MRERIERVFGCKAYDFYGSREVGPIAGECAQGSMHVLTFNNHVEVVDARGAAVEVGREGRILVTNLHNRAMPLIRYDIGDTAVMGDGACACGSPLPTLRKLTGRVTDHFVTRDGTLVHGEYFTHLFYYKDWVREFQVVQRDYDRVDVYWVAASAAPVADVRDIDDKIRLVLGDCTIDWHEVPEVPRTPQGKLSFTRSLVAMPRSS